MKDGKTGALIQNIRVNTAVKPHRLLALPDLNANGSAELALSEVNASTGKNVQIQVKDAKTGAKVRNIGLNPNYTPLSMRRTRDSNGNGTQELGVLEQNAAGKIQMQIKDSLTGGLIKNQSHPKF